MKKINLQIKNLLAGSITALLIVSGVSTAQVTTQSITYTGAMQTWTVPQCVLSVSLDLRGAEGMNSTANSPGGKGGRVRLVYPVTGGQVLNVFVGGKAINNNGGFNGGGTGSGAFSGGGGGGTDIRI